MTDRLADIRARIEGTRQLGSVVNAMRGVAAARAQQARGELAAADGYAATLAAAIGQVLALVPAPRPDPGAKTARPALVVFSAEQGFAGAFSERVLASAGEDLVKSKLFLIGTRGQVAINERGVVPEWTAAMPSHSPGIPKLADRIAAALYTRIAAGAIDRLDVIFCQSRPGQGVQVERRRLFPYDRTIFPNPASTNPPLLDLSPETLISGLTADYVHAQLCRAALHAFAAENETRMQTMAAARSQVEKQLASLEAKQRTVRQEAITAEVIELAAGESSSRLGV